MAIIEVVDLPQRIRRRADAFAALDSNEMPSTPESRVGGLAAAEQLAEGARHALARIFLDEVLDLQERRFARASARHRSGHLIVGRRSRNLTPARGVARISGAYRRAAAP